MGWGTGQGTAALDLGQGTAVLTLCRGPRGQGLDGGEWSPDPPSNPRSPSCPVGISTAWRALASFSSSEEGLGRVLCPTRTYHVPSSGVVGLGYLPLLPSGAPQALPWDPGHPCDECL